MQLKRNVRAETPTQAPAASASGGTVGPRGPGGGIDTASRRMALLWLGTTGLLLVVLALLGLLLRLTQAWGVLPDMWFYAILTLHGTGMVAVVLMALASVVWYLVRDQLPLSVRVNALVYVLAVVGSVLVVITTVIGHFGTGWTFLYPLPTHPGPLPGWNPGWTWPFLIGLALVVVAYAIWCIDFLRAGIARFGNPGKLLGFDILTGKAQPGDPGTTNSTIIAGAVMAITGIFTALPGAIIVALMLANAADPAFVLNALVAKELIFFTGHMLVNFDIYLGAAIAYSVLPHYAKRPWKASRAVVGVLILTLFLIMLPYFHHLYMDFAQPVGLAILGQVGSYGSAIPVAVVTVFGGLLLVYRSGMRWRPAPLFIFAGFVGWIIGGVGALIDSTPAVNQYYHNTLWVPAHFHTYMALGAVLFLLGGVFHIVPDIVGQSLSDRIGKIAAVFILVGGWGVVGVFFASGALSVPRRYAFVPVSLFELLARIGAVAAIVVACGIVLILGDFIRVLLPALSNGLPRTSGSVGSRPS
ncbi:MAG: cbb3-type cytochrome c oxidase subunit I [Pseudonocardiaceae bacterium]